jgi:hypothetical protein
MSASEPPERGLDEARAHLARQGYLRAALPDTLPRRWRAVVLIGAASVLLAVAMAWGAAAAGGAPLLASITLAGGFLPVVAVLVAAAVVIGRRVAQGLLGLGAAPNGIAEGLGLAAGLSVVAMVAAAVWGGASRPALGAAPPWIGGALLAVWAAREVRATLRRRLTFGASTPMPTGPKGWIGTAAIALAAAGALLPILAHRQPPRPPLAASFPSPQGRLAVLAVDGLAREDVDALAAADAGWRTLAGWGWARLDTGGERTPAVFWTTAACGVPPAEHGVLVLDEVRLFGASTGVSLQGLARAFVLVPWAPLGLARTVARPALERRAATFWEMASRAGCPITVGGWWGSWPVRRVLGEVVSERAWLGGGRSADAVTPALANAVSAAWRGDTSAADATDSLAELLAARAADRPSPRLCALSLPALDLLHRREHMPPIALAIASRRHLAALEQIMRVLVGGGYAVSVVGVPWGAGTPFVSFSTARGGEHPTITPLSLAAIWLTMLGLPPPAGGGTARLDLVGVGARTLPPAGYGPPPPPVAAPPLRALEIQREVLRNLGYLQ